ncbi:stage III sporulation protein AC [Lachnoclostridium phytofermentans ISDg]|uniref:Stage III sporulation protein AC n=1 Tax=Lachnoclostridium phytofermentans (strain ATCC 700394 / DSM 18823 / ISDg) TaxID=357809 RepID=A9KMC9_LACP7|nr:stage III sporulation protein AC [Lachnoclostridium phytofermentans ISDg]
MVSVINQILKQSDKNDYTIITSLAGLLIVLYWVIPYIADLFNYLQKLFQM